MSIGVEVEFWSISVFVSIVQRSDQPEWRTSGVLLYIRSDAAVTKYNDIRRPAQQTHNGGQTLPHNRQRLPNVLQSVSARPRRGTSVGRGRGDTSWKHFRGSAVSYLDHPPPANIGPRPTSDVNADWETNENRCKRAATEITGPNTGLLT